MNPTLSKTIGILRFPLAALIVFKHYYTPDVSAEVIGGEALQYQIYHYVGEFTNGVLPAMAVPLFFFISGYLYFNNIDQNSGKGYDFSMWKSKTYGRVKSLLIPYLSWNILVLLFFYVVQQMTGNSETMQKDGYKLIADYNMVDFLKSMYSLDSTGMPIDGPLWFIRNLFVVSVLITPGIYYYIKHMRIYGMVVLSAVFLVMGGVIDEHLYAGINSATIFYFSWGAYMSMNRIDMGTELENGRAFILGVLIFLTLAGFTLCYFSESQFLDYAKQMYVLTVVFCIFGCLGHWVKRSLLYIPEMLSTASFFIFAIHKPIQVILRRLFFTTLHPTQEWLLTLAVFVIPTMTILISLGCFYIIKKYIPFLKFLNGFRI